MEPAPDFIQGQERMNSNSNFKGLADREEFN
jgi:hypothetical protein